MSDEIKNYEETKVLVKTGTNPNKVQKTYKIGNKYRKEWTKGYRVKHVGWVNYHVRLLNEVKPGYLINYHADMETMIWCEYKEIPGVTIREMFQTGFFRRTVDPHKFKDMYKKFCLKNYEETFPHAHMDWERGNIIINGDWEDINNWDICDWDNLGTYPKKEVLAKIEKDVDEAFEFNFPGMVAHDRKFKSWKDLRRQIKATKQGAIQKGNDHGKEDEFK